MNKDKKIQIQQLLDLYYQGRTTEKDESRLRELLASDDTDPEFEADRMIFKALDANDDSIEVPADLDQRLSHVIDSWHESELEVKRTNRFKLRSFWPTIGIAASIAVICAIGAGLLNNTQQQPQLTDTFTDPMEAYEETQRVLTLFANTIDKSQLAIERAEQSQNMAFNIAYETLQQSNN